MPGTEAHGGYTFCAFASLVLLNSVSLCNKEGVLVSRHVCMHCHTDCMYVCIGVEMGYQETDAVRGRVSSECRL